MGVRDGVPLPGRTPAEVVSQLTHRVFGPLRLHRVQVVLDYHGLAGNPAAGRTEIAARYGIAPATVKNRVAKVWEAGARLPVSPDIVDQSSRASLVGEDHLGRTRIADTLSLPVPLPPPVDPSPGTAVAPRLPLTSGRAAARLLAAVGPLTTGTLLAAVNRSRRHHRRSDLSADDLIAALLAIGASLSDDGTWEPPPGTVAPQRYRDVVAAAGGRELTRHQMIEILTAAGFSPTSAGALVGSAHPLLHRAGPDRYRIIGQQ